MANTHHQKNVVQNGPGTVHDQGHSGKKRVRVAPEVSEATFHQRTRRHPGPLDMLRLQPDQETVKKKAKVYLLIVGLAALSTAVAMLIYAVRNNLRDFYIMGAGSLMFAICALGSSVFFTVRDRLVKRLREQEFLVKVTQCRNRSKELQDYVLPFDRLDSDKKDAPTHDELYGLHSRPDGQTDSTGRGAEASGGNDESLSVALPGDRSSSRFNADQPSVYHIPLRKTNATVA